MLDLRTEAHPENYGYSTPLFSKNSHIIPHRFFLSRSTNDPETTVSKTIQCRLDADAKRSFRKITLIKYVHGSQDIALRSRLGKHIMDADFNSRMICGKG